MLITRTYRDNRKAPDHYHLVVVHSTPWWSSFTISNTSHPSIVRPLLHQLNYSRCHYSLQRSSRGSPEITLEDHAPCHGANAKSMSRGGVENCSQLILEDLHGSSSSSLEWAIGWSALGGWLKVLKEIRIGQVETTFRTALLSRSWIWWDFDGISSSTLLLLVIF